MNVVGQHQNTHVIQQHILAQKMLRELMIVNPLVKAVAKHQQLSILVILHPIPVLLVIQEATQLNQLVNQLVNLPKLTIHVIHHHILALKVPLEVIPLKQHATLLVLNPQHITHVILQLIHVQKMPTVFIALRLPVLVLVRIKEPLLKVQSHVKIQTVRLLPKLSLVMTMHGVLKHQPKLGKTQVYLLRNSQLVLHFILVFLEKLKMIR